MTRGGKSEASRRSDIFERSPAAAGAARPALPTVEYARVSDELERRSREWTAMVRLLEQNRHTLDCAEMERDAAYDELARIVPIVQETAKELTEGFGCEPQRPAVAGPAGAVREEQRVSRSAREGLGRAQRLFPALPRGLGAIYARSVENAQRLRGEAPR